MGSYVTRPPANHADVNTPTADEVRRARTVSLLGWAIRAPIKPAMKVVLATLGMDADSNLRVMAEHARLARDCGLSRRHLDVTLSRLAAAGYLTRTHAYPGAELISLVVES